MIDVYRGLIKAHWWVINVLHVIKACNHPHHTCGLLFIHLHLPVSFLNWKPLKRLLFFFFFILYLIETRPVSPMNACGQTSHTWLLSLPLSRSLPWAFFSLVTGCHGFGSHCRLKTGGIKGGHFGDSWARLVLVAPCPAPSHSGGKRGGIVWGLELPVCQLITWGGKRGGVQGWGGEQKEWGREMKEKMKESAYERAYDIERGGQGRGGGREVAASTAALSITLIQALIILFTHTYTHTVLGNWNILKDFEGNKRQNKETATPRQRTPRSRHTESWNKQAKTDQQRTCRHRIRVMQTECLNR